MIPSRAASEAAARTFREESGRILATLLRVLGDWDLAEEALQDALAAALTAWSAGGVPENAGAWLTTTARRKAIDRLRRTRVREAQEAAVPSQAPATLLGFAEAESAEALDDDGLGGGAVPDERLRLFFTCCHPALALDAQVALTLQALAGLTTSEVARAFLVPVPTMAQRLVRAKRKIALARIPYRVPSHDVLPERLPGVLAVVYLAFNEGYATSSGEALVRRELCAEAIRLARVLASLLPAEPEVRGLLALLLLHDSRRDARITPEGDLVLLPDQDRSLWDETAAREGRALVLAALAEGRPGPYQVQAAIAAVHSEAARAAETDWPQVVALYDVLARLQPGPVVALNRAVAVAEARGADAGLALVEQAGNGGRLDDYLYYHSARGELLRRLGRSVESRAAYERAHALAGNATERRWLEGRLGEPLDRVDAD